MFTWLRVARHKTQKWCNNNNWRNALCFVARWVSTNSARECFEKLMEYDKRRQIKILKNIENIVKNKYLWSVICHAKYVFVKQTELKIACSNIYKH